MIYKKIISFYPYQILFLIHNCKEFFPFVLVLINFEIAKEISEKIQFIPNKRSIQFYF